MGTSSTLFYFKNSIKGDPEMKKLFLMAWLLVLFITQNLFAVETVTQSAFEEYNNVGTITFSCTCAADGSLATATGRVLSADNLAILQDGGWYLYKAHVNHGGTAPTDNSDITLVDGDGVDILGSAGTDSLDAAGHNEIFPLNGTTIVKQPIISTFTLTLANQNVNSATFSLTLYFVKD